MRSIISLPKRYCTTAECFHESLCTLELRLGRSKGVAAGCNLIWVDETFAIETQFPSVIGFLFKSLGILKVVEHSVEAGNASRARSQNDQLKRRRNWLAACLER